MVRRNRLGRLDAELLRKHRSERLDLHLAESRQRTDSLPQIRAVSRLRPDSRSVAAVLLGHHRGQFPHAAGHRAGKAVDRRLLGEHGREVDRCELLRLERAGPLLQHVGTGERLLHGHLLVDREAHEQGERIGREELARLGVVGEPERSDHPPILVGAPWPGVGRRRARPPAPDG